MCSATIDFGYKNSTARQLSLAVVHDLPLNRKDLPLLLNGTFCRTCTDFGADANVINARFARKLGLAVDSRTRCPPFELPTFKKHLTPSGRVPILREFPQEPTSRASEGFFRGSKTSCMMCLWDADSFVKQERLIYSATVLKVNPYRFMTFQLWPLLVVKTTD
jgi:hypothetical protein